MELRGLLEFLRLLLFAEMARDVTEGASGGSDRASMASWDFSAAGAAN